MKLIHTADWQLGKPFGRIELEVRVALTEARFDAIDAIGKAAKGPVTIRCWGKKISASANKI